MPRRQRVGVIIELDFASFTDDSAQKVQRQCPWVVRWSGRDNHGGLLVRALFLTTLESVLLLSSSGKLAAYASSDRT